MAPIYQLLRFFTQFSTAAYRIICLGAYLRLHRAWLRWKGKTGAEALRQIQIRFFMARSFAGSQTRQETKDSDSYPCSMERNHPHGQ